MTVLTLTAITAWATYHRQEPQSQAKDATPVTEGVMTAKQVEHSKLYTQTKRPKRLTDAPDGTTIIVGLPWADVSANSKLTLENYLQETTCKADVAVLVLVKSKASQLTVDGTFIFTDYEVVIEDVLKNNSNAAVQPKQEITVTRSGGVVNLNGKILAVKDKSFKPLEAGKTYLLFLSYLPSTGAYKPLNSESSFDIGNRQLLPLTEEEPSDAISSMKDGATVINQIRTLANNCGNSGGEK
jgi:hypothetical protein